MPNVTHATRVTRSSTGLNRWAGPGHIDASGRTYIFHFWWYRHTNEWTDNNNKWKAIAAHQQRSASYCAFFFCLNGLRRLPEGDRQRYGIGSDAFITKVGQGCLQIRAWKFQFFFILDAFVPFVVGFFVFGMPCCQDGLCHCLYALSGF